MPFGRGAVPSRPRGLRHQEKVASCIPCAFVNVPSVSSTSSGTDGGMAMNIFLVLSTLAGRNGLPTESAAPSRLDAAAP